MKLYYAETMNSWKTCAVARLVGPDVSFRPINLKSGEQRCAEFLAINPNGKVPVLVDGDKTIWESNAIMCHLAIVAGSDLWPRDARQVEIVRWFGWAADHFCRFAGELYFENVIRAEFDMGAPNPASVAEALGYVRHYSAILDTHLDGRSYLVGEALSLADFAVATILPWAEAAQIPLDEFPAVRRWHERLMELPAWRSPFPAQIEDA